MRYGILIGIWALSIFATRASLADAHIQFIDVGIPKNGAVVMDGWLGVIVRIVSDGGQPITRVDFSPQNDFGDIAGNIAQRWTDPTGQGNYTQTSPGPITANNTFDSEFNFDSHTLGTAGTYTASSASERNQHEFLTSRTGLTSDGFVGYGASAFVNYHVDPILFQEGGHLGGILDIAPGFQSDSFDAAYVVTDSAFQAFANVTAGGQIYPVSGIFEVPEPGSGLIAIVTALFASFRRSKRDRAQASCATIQSLEPRMLLTVPVPTNVAATMETNGSATISGTIWVPASVITYNVQ